MLAAPYRGYLSLSPSLCSSSAVALTCGSDYSCATSTDTVLPDVVCAAGECTDAECCEPGERIPTALASNVGQSTLSTWSQNVFFVAATAMDPC